MQEKVILGVDIAKQKFDVCLMLGSKVRHKMFDNTESGYKKLLEWCKHQGVADMMHVCMEATSIYMEGLAHYLHDIGHKVSIVNPAQIKAFTRSELLRGKSDKSDAGAIARFCQTHVPMQWSPLPLEVRQLRDMHRVMQSLKEQKQQVENKLENKGLHKVAKQALVKVIRAIEKEIGLLEEEIKQHIDKHPDIKSNVELLTSIKGVGINTACSIIAEMPSTDCFADARQYAAFAGLTPAHQQSGSSLNKKGTICKIGSERIRKALYMPAIVIKNYNEHFKEFCQRLASKGKPPKVIVVALMRKVMHIFFGMLKNKQQFNPSLL